MQYCRKYPDAVAEIRGGVEAPQLSGCVQFYQGNGCMLIVARISGLPKGSETGFFGFHNALEVYEILHHRNELRCDHYVNKISIVRESGYRLDVIAYGDWSEMAQELRRAYLDGKISAADFIAKIDIYHEYPDFAHKKETPPTGDSTFREKVKRDLNFDPNNVILDGRKSTEVNRSCNMEFGSMDIQRETRLSKPVVTDTDLVIILPQIVEGELYMERMGIGDHLYGAKSRILRFVDGRNDCQCLFVGLAAKIPAAKVAVLGKSFG